MALYKDLRGMQRAIEADFLRRYGEGFALIRGGRWYVVKYEVASHRTWEVVIYDYIAPTSGERFDFIEI